MINELSNYLDIALDVVKTGSSEFNQNILKYGRTLKVSHTLKLIIMNQKKATP